MMKKMLCEYVRPVILIVLTVIFFTVVYGKE